MPSTAKRPDWVHLLFIGGLHLTGLLGLLYLPRAIDVALFLVFYLLTGFGVTIGYHRLLAHRAFDTSLWMRRLFAVLGAAALEGGPAVWVGTHRRHHGSSDQPGDPHSPREGFFRSHIGWIFECRDKDLDRKRAQDLMRDPFVRFLDSNHFFVWLSTVAICFAIAGPRGALWGGVIRTLWTWNVTWSVNSFCHVFGRRTYDTPEGSRNLWWVGVLALGEGWHNNHHAYQRSAIAGETPWQVDASGYVVRLLERAGLVWDVKRSPALRGARAHEPADVADALLPPPVPESGTSQGIGVS
jgi:stearoyl-CoA desaturase (Delta-9 desaturase)